MGLLQPPMCPCRMWCARADRVCVACGAHCQGEAMGAMRGVLCLSMPSMTLMDWVELRFEQGPMEWGPAHEWGFPVLS